MEMTSKGSPKISCVPGKKHNWQHRPYLDRPTDGWLGFVCLNCAVVARFPPRIKATMTNQEMVEWLMGLGKSREERIYTLEDMIKNATQDGMSSDDYTICETALKVLQQMEADDKAHQDRIKKNRVRAAMIVEMKKEDDELWTPVTVAPTEKHDQIEAAYTFPEESK